jgi:hypothetical protein
MLFTTILKRGGNSLRFPQENGRVPFLPEAVTFPPVKTPEAMAHGSSPGSGPLQKDIDEILRLDNAFDSLSLVNIPYRKKLLLTANCFNLDLDTSLKNGCSYFK